MFNWTGKAILSGVWKEKRIFFSWQRECAYERERERTTLNFNRISSHYDPLSPVLQLHRSLGVHHEPSLFSSQPQDLNSGSDMWLPSLQGTCILAIFFLLLLLEDACVHQTKREAALRRSHSSCFSYFTIPSGFGTHMHKHSMCFSFFFSFFLKRVLL